MAELMELVGSSGWTEGSTAKTTGREGRAMDAHELLTSFCDNGRAQLVRTAKYGIRGQSEARAGDRVCELSVLLGGGGEHLGVPFYRLRKWGCATGLLARLQWHCCGRMLGRWSDETAFLVIERGMQMDGGASRGTVDSRYAWSVSN